MNNEKKFIKLTPFKMQVLESFPFIDADFDAITNYELLCKVVEYLNITVDNVNLLESDLKILYDYVHDYFDNLDVQDEINNKLDEMATDGTLNNIINQEIFGKIQDRITNIEKDTKDNMIKNPVLEYMHTIHTTSTNIQGMCADDNYYYLYDYDNKLIYQRSLASNELINTFNVDFLHGNDITILNNIIYSANFEDRYIRYYDITNNTSGVLAPFETQEIINRNLTKMIGITKYDENTLLCSLGGNVTTSTKITDLSYFKVDLSNNNSYTEVTLTNTKNININAQSVLQGFEYQDGKLYFLNSQPTQIIVCNETETNSFNISDIFNYPTYDILGIAYGEAEGITILPSNFNGDKTLMIMSQVDRWEPSSQKTLKFYCFNIYTHLPETRYGSFYENGSNKQLVQVNANATNYFENGKSSYPFKDLCSAMEFINNYNGGGQNLQLYAGNYYIQECRNFKAMIIPFEDGVNILGNVSIINSNISIGNVSHKCNISANSFIVSYSKLTLVNCNFTSNNTSTRVIQQDSDVHMIDVDLVTNSYTQIKNSKVVLKLTSASRLPSGQVFGALDGSQIFLCNNIIPNASISNDGSCLICSPGRVNNT